MRWLSRLITTFTSEDRAIARRADADFGEMWLNTHNVWRARVAFPPTTEDVSLYFERGTEDGPTEWQRGMFRELINRYNSLQSEMEEPLWREYEEIRKNWELASAPLPESKQIWSVASLFAIEVLGEGSAIDFSLDHCIDWDNEDHDLNVRIKDWKVLDVAMEG